MLPQAEETSNAATAFVLINHVTSAVESFGRRSRAH
jgi:hypothetical protein